MKVIRAKSAGFCWGVERAIDIAREYAQKGRHPVYTDGPLIHNRQMMEVLTGEGIREVGDYRSETKLEVSQETDAGAVMVVRAHGISPERREYLKSLGMEFRDATCPDVGIIAGKVRMVAPTVDAATRNGLVYVDLPQPGPASPRHSLCRRFPWRSSLRVSGPGLAVVHDRASAPGSKGWRARQRVRTGNSRW